MSEAISVDDVKDAVSEVLSEQLEAVLEEKLEDALEDALTDQLEEVLEEKLDDALEDHLEDAISDVLGNYLPEALNECLSAFEFVLKDGTVVRPRQTMRLLSPDRTTVLPCYGGLKVCHNEREGTYGLLVQTRISCWENIASYSSREEAVAKLQLVRKAMDDGMASFEL